MEHFIIWSAGFNCEKYVEKYMESVNNQTYMNYTAVVVDDASTDNTWNEIKRYKTDKHLICRNEKNIKNAANMIKWLAPNVKNTDVIVVLDLDDWFAHDSVLERLNEIYTNEKCWTTYGHYKHLLGDQSMCGYSPEVLHNKSFRECGWLWHHLKTFKGFLFHNIKEDDFKGPDGNYVSTTWDLVLGFPILEMAPTEKIRYIPEVLMVYNAVNPLRDCVVNKQHTSTLPKFIRSKPKYNTLKVEDYDVLS